MKKTIILIVLAFIVAMGCWAQESDSTKVARYNSRHTMRGYRAFYETGYFFGLDGENDDPRFPNKFSVTTSQGIQLNNFVYLGVGIGVDTYRYSGTNYVSVPMFADLRVNCMNDKKVMPFFDIRLGYSVGSRVEGIYWENQLGVRRSLKKRHAIFAAVDFVFQYNTYSTFILDTDMGVYCALGFKIGYEF